MSYLAFYLVFKEGEKALNKNTLKWPEHNLVTLFASTVKYSNKLFFHHMHHMCLFI